MPRVSLLVSLVVCAALSASCEDDADAQTQWFDAEPLLQNLSEADRGNAARYVQPATLDQLTLHDLQIRIADDLASFTAVEDIYYTNTTGSALRTLVLRIYGNAVGERPAVRLTESRCVDAQCQVAFDGKSVIEVRPSAPLAPGAHLRVKLQLAGALKEIQAERSTLMGQAMEGLSRMGAPGAEHGDYGLMAHGSGIASLGNFYATVAPRRSGRWVRGDESTLGDLGADGVVHFRAKVKAPQGSRVAVTGHTLNERTVLGRNGQPGFTEVRAVAGLTRNFAVVLSKDFEVATAEVHGAQVRSFFLPADRRAGEAALETAKAALNSFHRRFGPYPYTDLEVVEAPLVGGAGGVEFSGLVTVAQMFYSSGGGGGPMGMLSSLLGGGGGAGLLGGSGAVPGGGAGGAGAGAGPLDEMQSAMLDFVVAHEVAHQWWHGLVGSDAREHPFVDESLAQFSAMLYVEDRFGDERAQQEADRQVKSNYHFMRMRNLPDGAVDRPVAAFGDEMAYAGLVYGKGPYLYPALREALGERAFFDGVRAYVRAHRFAVAEPRALFDRLARGRHQQTVRRLERHWLEQSHGDEDLGEANMGALAGQWFGGGNPMDILGSSGLGGLGNLGGAGAGGGAQVEQALQQLLQGLQQMQGGAP